jgi:hypothetical protein
MGGKQMMTQLNKYGNKRRFKRMSLTTYPMNPWFLCETKKRRKRGMALFSSS